MADNTIGVRALWDNGQFEAGLARYLTGLSNANSRTSQFAGNLGTQFLGLGKSVLGFGAIAAGAAVGGVAALTVGIGAMGIVSTKAAISFESAFAGIAKTVDNVADAEGNLTANGEALFQQFRDLAKEIPVAFEELARIGELGGQLGIAQDSLLEFTQTIAQVGVTTNLTSEEAALAFAQIANILQLPQDNIDNLASAIVELGNNFATTERDIVAFTQRIAGAGQIAGLTAGDLAGIAAAFSSVGVEAEAGGTAVQKVLIGMNTAVATGSAELEKFASVAGMSADEFSAAWEADAGAAFASFVQGLGAAGDDAVGILDDLGLADQRLVRGFLSVAQAGELLPDAMNAANSAFEQNTALALEAQKRFATTAAQLQVFKNVIRDLAVTLGGPLVSALTTALQSARPFIDEFGVKLANFVSTTLGPAIERLAVSFASNLPGAIEKVSGFITGTLIPAWNSFSSVMGTILPVIGEIASVLGDVLGRAMEFVSQNADVFKGALAGIGAVLAGAGIAAAIVGIATAISAIASPIGIIVALAGVLGAAWAGNWGGIRDTVISIWEGSIRPALEQLVNFLQEAIPVALEIASRLWEGVLAPALEAVGTLITGVVLPVLGQLATFLISKIPVAVEFFKSVWLALLPVYEAVGSFIKTTVIPALETLGAWLSTNLPVALEAASNIWQTVFLPALQAVGDFITGTVIPVITELINWLQINIPVAIQAVSEFWNTTFLPALQAVGDFITGTLVPIFEEIVAWLGERIGEATQTLSDIWNNTLLPAFQAVGDFITGSIIPFFESLANVAGAVLGVAIEILAGIWNDILVPALEAAWEWLANNIGPVLETVAGIMEGVFTAASETVAGIWNDTLAPALETVWSWLSENIGPVLETVAGILSGVFTEATEGAKTAIDLLKDGLSAISGVLSTVTGWFDKLAEAIKGISWEKVKSILAAWLPGSLPPLAQGFSDVAGAAEEAAGVMSGTELTGAMEEIGGGSDTLLEKMEGLATGLGEAFSNLLSGEGGIGDIFGQLFGGLFGGGEEAAANGAGDFSGVAADIEAQILPLIESLTTAITEGLGTAFQTLSEQLNSILVPTLTAVSALLTEGIIVTITALTQTLVGVLVPALQALAEILLGSIIPTLTLVQAILTEGIMITITALAEMLVGLLIPTLQLLNELLVGVLVPTLTLLQNILVEGIMTTITALVEMMAGLLIPTLQLLITMLTDGVMVTLIALNALLVDVILVTLTTLNTFLVDVLMVTLATLNTFLVDILMVTLTTLNTFLVEVLLVSLAALNTFLLEVLMVTLAALNTYIVEVVMVTIENIVLQIEDDLIPAIEDVVTILKDDFIPSLQQLVYWLTQTMMAIAGAIQQMDEMGGAASVLEGALRKLISAAQSAAGALGGVASAAAAAAGAMRAAAAAASALAGALQEIQVPSGLKQTSPSPIEQSLIDMMKAGENSLATIYALERALDKLRRGPDVEIAVELKNFTPEEITENLGLGLLEAASRNFQKASREAAKAEEPKFVSLAGEILDLAGELGSLGQGFVGQWNKRVVEPAKEGLKTIDERIKEVNRSLSVKGPEALTADKRVAAEAELVRLEQQRLQTQQEIVALQERQLKLQQQQEDLRFLELQLDLIKLIQEEGLDAREILGGFEFGLDADIGNLIDIMTNAMGELIKAAEKELGIASPSREFERIARLAVAGFERGLEGFDPFSLAASKMQASRATTQFEALARQAFKNVGRMTSDLVRVSVNGGASGGDVTNISRNVTVEVNPTYEQVASPANIYYDVLAALTAARV